MTSEGLDARDPNSQASLDLLFTPYGYRDRLNSNFSDI